MRNSPLLAVAAAVCGFSLIVTSDAIAKYLGRMGYDVAQIVWARFAFSLLLIMVIRPQWLRRMFATRYPGLHATRALIMLGITIMFFVAVRLMPLAEATTLSLVSPLLIAALSVPILRERVTPSRWAAIILGFVGVLVMLRPGSGVIQWAALLPLGTALFAAVYHITTRVLHRVDNPLTTLYYIATINTVLTSFVVPARWMTPDALVWTLLAVLGVSGTLAHFLLIRAFSMAPPSLISPFTYTQLVISMALGFFLFGEVPDKWTLAGAAIIATCGIYVLYDEQKTQRAIARERSA